MTKRNLKLLKYPVFLILVLAFFWLGFYWRKPSVKSPSLIIQEEQKTVTPSPQISTSGITAALTLDFGEGKTATYSLEKMTKEEATALGILEKKTKEEGIVLESKKYDFGSLVTNIGGLENTGEKAWMYFINNQEGSVAAEKYELKNGDAVTWKYLKFRE